MSREKFNCDEWTVTEQTPSRERLKWDKPLAKRAASLPVAHPHEPIPREQRPPEDSLPTSRRLAPAKRNRTNGLAHAASPGALPVKLACGGRRDAALHDHG